MSREKPKELYISKVSRFGNGAKLKAFKKHINKEMIIMTKEKYKHPTKKEEKLFNEADNKMHEIDEKALDKLLEKI